MIPKKIHYCWFGRNKKTKLAQRCISSWKKFCSDYEIIEWNEDNFDVHRNFYTNWCFENKKWAFLSDYVRLEVVKKYGGVYFDTDVELIRPIDELLKYKAFYAFETPEYIASGLGFGSEAFHSIICAMEREYQEIAPGKQRTFLPIGCPILNTKALESFGLLKNGKMQIIEGALLLPMDYMNPYEDATGRLNTTENTFSIHWYSKSALNRKIIFCSKLSRPIHRLFGIDCLKWLKK